MRVKYRLTDMSEWVLTIRRACHVLFLYELKGYRYVLFCWCQDPQRTPQTVSTGQGPEQMSEPDIRLTNSDPTPNLDRFGTGPVSGDGNFL